MVNYLAWRLCAHTTTGAPQSKPSISWASVGRCWSCASFCLAQALHRPAGRSSPRQPQRPRPAPARAGGGGGGAAPQAPPPAASRVYELTGWGLELEPVIVRLGRWGARSPSKPRDAALGIDSLILTFRTMFDPRAADGLRASYQLRLGEDSFHAEVADGGFEVVRGVAERPDAIIEVNPGTLAALVYDGRQLTEALRSGDLKIEGDEAAVARFLGLFPLPEPAAPAGGA